MLRRIRDWAHRRVGGSASAKLIAIFASVLALNSADVGAIGAMADRIEAAFGVGKTDLGLIVSISSLVSAVATLPFGWLVDRVNRTRMLAYAIVLWAASMTVMACATSYVFLLVTRVALGAVVAVAGPAIASLVGDWFDPRRRGRVWGAILSGELIGTGFGFLVAGQLATFSWRLGVASLIFPALLIAWLVHRIPEPERGGASRIAEGQEELETKHEGAREEPELHAGTRAVREKIEEQNIPPRDRLVLDEDPGEKSLWWAMGYVLRVPTNLVLIAASALGYYFFTGARTFGVEFVAGYFGLGHSNAIWLVLALGIAGLGGVLVGGWAGDALLSRGHVSGRPIVAAAAYLASACFFMAMLLVPTIGLAIVPFFLAAGALGAMNPPLDAARLDIMHPRMWGRAESVRMFVRLSAEGIAPVLFGWVADHFFRNAGDAEGLRDTFLVMLVPLFASGLVALIAIKTYPRDVATAEAYAQRTSGGHRDARQE